MAGCGGKKKMEAGGLAKAAKRARKLNDDISTRKGFTEKLNRKPGAGGMLGGARPMAPGGKKRMLPDLIERGAPSPMDEARRQSQKPARRKAGGMLKTPDNPGLKKLPTEVRNKMGYMKKGGMAKKKMAAGGLAKAAVKAVKKVLPKKKETNPYKSTVGDSYADRAKKQGEIEQFILKDKSIYKTKKDKDEALKTLSERMKRERKETLNKKMGMKKGGKVYCKDGCAVRGKTRGKLV